MSTIARRGGLSAGHVLNAGVGVALVAAQVFVLFVLPRGPMAAHAGYAWLLLPALLLTSTHWALLHEAIHGLLHPSPGINRAAGRVLAILGGSSFRVLRFGHLMHHRFNRYRMDRPDCYDPAEVSPARARLRYYGELFGGLYLVEVIVPLLFLLPRRACERLLARVYAHPDATVQTVGELARQSFVAPRRLRELRIDALLAMAVHGAAMLAWGVHWPLLVAFLAGRAVIVSFTDNVYHYGTPLERRRYAYNLHLPPLLRLILLNMNLHRVHHREPQLPWWRLPSRLAECADRCDDAYHRAALRQLRGPRPLEPFASAKQGGADMTAA